MISWFPFSPQVRLDWVRKIIFTDVEQSWYRFGFDFSTQTESIYKPQDVNSRVLVYRNAFINSISYEIESTKYLAIKREYSFLNYCTNLGGFGSLLIAISSIINMLESVHFYVASDLLESQEK